LCDFSKNVTSTKASGCLTEPQKWPKSSDIPLKRIGQPKDIADAVLFFASEQASWITGQIIFVNGGHRMNLGQ
jgi:3-oxoacyl-[acyl-carrier protein] reductase